MNREDVLRDIYHALRQEFSALAAAARLYALGATTEEIERASSGEFKAKQR